MNAMKKLIFIMLCTSMLTACANNTVNSEETTIQTDASEISVISQTEAETEQETTPPDDGEPASEENTEESTSAVEESHENYGVKFIDEIYNLPTISKGYLISYVTKRGDEVSITSENVKCTVKLHDVKTGELVMEYPMPEGYEIDEIVVGGDGICSVVLDRFYEDPSSEIGRSHEYRTALISEDLSVAVGDYTSEAASINVCGREIAEWGMDIIDPESGDVLVAGFVNEDNFYENRKQYYMFPLDENQFVYRTGGVECIPGFGIYDFSTGAATDAPDSKDLMPFGVYDGKIYSTHSAWDGFGTDVYITDAETFETELYIDLDTEGVFNGCFLNHFMYNGEIFVLGQLHAADEQCLKLFRLTPDDAEVVYEYPEKYSSFFYTGVDRESGILYSNYAIHDVGNGAILVELSKITEDSIPTK